MSQIFYDRVDILVNNVLYLPNGEIVDVSVRSRLNNNLVQSMTSTGQAAGVVYGNTEISLDWREIFPASADYINWETFMLGNPDVTITIIPYSLAAGVPAPAQFSITGIIPTDVSVAAPGEGQYMHRTCSFRAISSLNLN